MNRLKVFGYLALIAALNSCEKQNIKASSEATTESVDYLMFGHYGGFCYKCDAIYKIQNGRLYGANHLFISNPDSTQLSQFSNSFYLLVKDLTNQVPSQLLATNSSAIGTYFPDVGLTYIEIGKNKQIHRWYVEAGNTPTYLQGFLHDIKDAIAKLN